MDSDPIVAASSIVMGLQTIVSRNVDPTQAAVVTVGKLAGGSAPNVIPGEVELSISVRSFDPEVRRLLERRITQLVGAQAESYGVTAVIDYRAGYPVVTNTDAETELAIQVAKELVGEDRVTEQMAPLMGSEDFAYMLQERRIIPADRQWPDRWRQHPAQRDLRFQRREPGCRLRILGQAGGALSVHPMSDRWRPH